MPMNLEAQINQFLSSKAFGVVGASGRRHKFGNKVLRCYLQHGKTAYPINPRESIVEGIASVETVTQLPSDVESISIITPAAVTERVVEEAIKKGIKNIWMQPGAESEKAIHDCNKNGINVIAKGPCLLVELGFIDE
ncbi:CoA-binding protein [Legionella hackeliae]|uniref:CoA-binding protein n=1 Tax=Legionella hackeliae TaxID=449 RepID=A0A0A8UP92_LEGHA|nr:CoA-binding protein [Legionella hackeliae]KTD13506.1 CoA-binding protein [Legionella hackeliae]CEK09351.1 CoA-binding protein [Legionella hackeliae]STX49257.1 CoA-binding protein [Legionella hackeliae]